MTYHVDIYKDELYPFYAIGEYKDGPTELSDETVQRIELAFVEFWEVQEILKAAYKT